MYLGSRFFKLIINLMSVAGNHSVKKYAEKYKQLKMSKKIGFNYNSNSISKHSDSFFKEEEEVFDYVNNKRRKIKRYSKRTNIKTGQLKSWGIGYFPDSKPALKGGNSCKTVAIPDDTSSKAIGLIHKCREVKPMKGTEESDSDDEIDVCPKNPERPGLKYKRTRSRRATYKEGDHISESNFGIGFNW